MDKSLTLNRVYLVLSLYNCVMLKIIEEQFFLNIIINLKVNIHCTLGRISLTSFNELCL